jgi:hypothetical protein
MALASAADRSAVSAKRHADASGVHLNPTQAAQPADQDERADALEIDATRRHVAF